MEFERWLSHFSALIGDCRAVDGVLNIVGYIPYPSSPSQLTFLPSPSSMFDSVVVPLAYVPYGGFEGSSTFITQAINSTRLL